MKKLISILITCLVMIGCGDDVTNINGYTDEEVRTIIDSTLDAQDVKLMSDTVYQQTVDTIYNMVIDTVTHELVDTIYQRVVDTVTNELVDTIYSRVVDTVYKELVDTIYHRVVDTVFTELHNAGIDVERPRDTTITVYDTTDGAIISKIYTGVVYKRVFYEANAYQYLYTDKRDEGKSYSAKIEYFHVPNTQFTVLDYSYETNCRGDACGIQGTVYYPDQCGIISKPDYNDAAYRSKESIKKIGKWRMFDGSDAVNMAQYLNMLVPDTTLIYLSTIEYDTNVNGDFTANVAKYKISSMVSTNKSKTQLKYICAYDL